MRKRKLRKTEKTNRRSKRPKRGGEGFYIEGAKTTQGEKRQTRMAGTRGEVMTSAEVTCLFTRA